MTTVDVNTSRNTGRSSHAATVLQTNLEAAEEIARQLRLRNLGGLCVIDFIHMDSDEDEDEVLDVLLDALEDDPAFIRATEFSELGLVELARRRGAGPLAARLVQLEGNAQVFCAQALMTNASSGTGFIRGTGVRRASVWPVPSALRVMTT